MGLFQGRKDPDSSHYRDSQGNKRNPYADVESFKAQLRDKKGDISEYTFNYLMGKADEVIKKFQFYDEQIKAQGSVPDKQMGAPDDPYGYVGGIFEKDIVGVRGELEGALSGDQKEKVRMYFQEQSKIGQDRPGVKQTILSVPGTSPTNTSAQSMVLSPVTRNK